MRSKEKKWDQSSENIQMQTYQTKYAIELQKSQKYNTINLKKIASEEISLLTLTLLYEAKLTKSIDYQIDLFNISHQKNPREMVRAKEREKI